MKVDFLITYINVLFNLKYFILFSSANPISRIPSVCAYRSVFMSSATHIKARCPVYPGSHTNRFPVPDDKVDWETDWPQYSPVTYTDPFVLKKPVWADPEIG